MNVRRILKPSYIISVVLVLFAWVYARPLGLLLAAKQSARSQPELGIVPKPLTDVSIDWSEGRTFSFFGYQFEAPWTEVRQEKILKSIAIVNFSNGASVIFFDPAKGVDFLATLTGKGTKNEATLKKIFSDEATRSNYGLRSAILYLTPGDLRLFSSRQEMVASSVLLMMKPTWAKGKKGGLYSFQTERIRGFQDGDPAYKRVMIYAFDAQDHEIQLVIASGQAANQNFTQSEVNRIVHSLHAVPNPAQVNSR